MTNDRKVALGRRAAFFVVAGLVGRLALVVIPGNGDLLSADFSATKVTVGIVALISVVVGVILAAIALWGVGATSTSRNGMSVIAGLLGVPYLVFFAWQVSAPLLNKVVNPPLEQKAATSDGEEIEHQYPVSDDTDGRNMPDAHTPNSAPPSEDASPPVNPPASALVPLDSPFTDPPLLSPEIKTTPEE